jgi:hypothetical protein
MKGFTSNVIEAAQVIEGKYSHIRSREKSKNAAIIVEQLSAIVLVPL